MFQTIEEIAKILITNLPDRKFEDDSIKPRSTEKIKINCCEIL